MQDSYMRPRDFTVCGVVGVCAMTKEQCVREIYLLPKTPVSATVNLVGIPAVISAKENAAIAEVYNQATISTIDGMPLVKKARRKGLVCERCAAPDIMGPIFKEGLQRGTKHFFYGGKNDAVLEKLQENLQRDYPGIQIVGVYSPPFRPLTDEEDAAVCKTINDLQPDFLWVCIGAPKQESWMQAHRDRIHGCVMLGVGAGIDFLAGTLDKAPKWMEESSLEWAYRLMKEPKRLWRRYIIGGIKYAYYSSLQLIKAGINKAQQ